MYSYIIDVDDELWDIIDDGINFSVNSDGIVIDRKRFTDTQFFFCKKMLWTEQILKGPFT